MAWNSLPWWPGGGFFDPFRPAKAFNALLEQMIGQKSADASAARKPPVSAHFDKAMSRAGEGTVFQKVVAVIEKF
jgi:hypothetical protein